MQDSRQQKKHGRFGKTQATKKSKLKKILRVNLFSGFLFFLSTGLIGAVFIYFYYSRDLPDVGKLKDHQPSTITQVYSADNEKIAEFYIEKRIIIALEDIPLSLKQATLAVEDSNFYSHFGIDPKAIFRAFITNLKAGHIVEGGSTITQQLTKTMFLSREKSLPRKIKEAILALRLELVFSKDEILEMYLNQIYYGHGTYGVEAAARNYFAKSVKDLTIAECAMIASLPKAPNNYSPYRNPKKALKRRNHVIRRMADISFISKEQAKFFMGEEFNLGKVEKMLNKAPYFVEHVRRILEEKFGSNKLYRAGLKVYTTLDIKMQETAQRTIKKNLLVADKRYGYRGPIGTVDISRGELTVRKTLIRQNGFVEGKGIKIGETIYGTVMSVGRTQVRVILGAEDGYIDIKDMNWARKPNPNLDGRWVKIKNPSEAITPGNLIMVKVLGRKQDGTGWSLALEQEPEVQAALISLSTLTGQVKSMVGGYDYNKSQFNRAVQAIRQPGSAFKPIIYAAAVNQGYGPSSIIIDSPIIFKDKKDAFEKWKPVNFEEKFYGPTSLREALAHSRNVVTVKLMQKIGINSTIRLARSLGITTNLEENLSIALGSSGTTLYELTSAYSAFANLGNITKPTVIRNIKSRQGKVLFTAEPDTTQPISSETAHIMTSLMQSVVQNGTAKKIKSLKRPVAGKTGTTNNYVDAWFIGYTPELVTGVWVGKDKDKPLGRNETGSRAAIPIWLQFMQKVLANKPIINFPVSSNIQFIKVQSESRKPAKYSDTSTSFELFSPDFLPEKEQPFSLQTQQSAETFQ